MDTMKKSNSERTKNVVAKRAKGLALQHSLYVAYFSRMRALHTLIHYCHVVFFCRVSM